MKQNVLSVATSPWTCKSTPASHQKKLHWLAIICVSALMSSCSITPAVEDAGQPTNGLPETTGNGRLATTTTWLPDTVALHKVDLYLRKDKFTTGMLTVQLCDSTGMVLDSAHVSVDSVKTGSSWNTFRFRSSHTLRRGRTYRLYVRRSHAHNSAGQNAIYWMTSTPGADAYPGGINDVINSWTLDYGFRTYANGGIDQQQTQIGYGFFTSNSFSRWQEFKVDYPKVNLTSIALNLHVGSAATGRLCVAIQSENHLDTLAKSIVQASTLPVGMNWVTFNMPVTLYRDQKYAIYVYRTEAHNYPTNNYIFWRTSSGGINAYPDGVNDVYPSWTLDYAFKTYSSGSGLDQQQTLNTYGFFLSSGVYRWQEFIPRQQ